MSAGKGTILQQADLSHSPVHVLPVPKGMGQLFTGSCTLFGRPGQFGTTWHHDSSISSADVPN
jgi:hypothetical protein